MGNWQRKHFIVTAVVSVLLFAVWGLLARRNELSEVDALTCIRAQGNAYLDIKRELANAEQRLQVEGKESASMPLSDDKKVKGAIGFFAPDKEVWYPNDTDPNRRLVACGVAANPNNVSYSVFKAGSLLDQRKFLETLASEFSPYFQLVKEQTDEPQTTTSDSYIDKSKALIFLIFSGLAMDILLAFLLTALANHILLYPSQLRLKARTYTLTETFKQTIQRFPFEKLFALLSAAPLLLELRQDVGQLESQKRMQSRSEEMDWFNVSRILFKAGTVSKAKKQRPLEAQVEELHRIAQRILRSQLGSRLLSMLDDALFLLFFAVIALVWRVMAGADWIENFLFPWITTLAWAMGGVAAVQGLLPLLEYALRWFTEKTWTDFDDLIVGVLGGPIVAAALAGILYELVQYIPSEAKFFLSAMWDLLNSEKWVQALLTVIIGWLAVFILNKVIVYALLKWSERTEQKYDDMFVRIVQVFGTFIFIAITFGVLLANFQADISRATGVDNILLPYSIIVSVFSAVLGYASRQAIENFFGGVLLQVDRPFNPGERLKLETGEICDVREIGMRSTVLYNVMESTEISIPNNMMGSMKVTNISRPDYSLRLSTHVTVPHLGHLVKRVETILLDIGYLEGEVDQARITEDEVGSPQRTLGRRSVLEELNLLVNAHPQIQSTVIARIEGGGHIVEKPIFPQIYERLERIRNWRLGYAAKVQGMSDDLHKALQNLPDDDGTALSRFQDFAREFDLGLYQAFGANGEIIYDPKDNNIETFKNILHSSAAQYDFLEDTENLQSALLSLRGKQSKQNFRDKKAEQRAIALNLSEWHKKREEERSGLISKIRAEFELVSELVFAIANSHPHVRSDLDRLISEISKEPTVSSTEKATSDKPYVELEFGFYATFMERQEAVLYKVNKEIRRRLWRTGIIGNVKEIKDEKSKS